MTGSSGETISKQEFFNFVVRLGVFAPMNMDWPNFGTLNVIIVALLQDIGLLEEFRKFSRDLGIPTEHIMPVGQC